MIRFNQLIIIIHKIEVLLESIKTKQKIEKNIFNINLENKRLKHVANFLRVIDIEKFFLF